MSNLGIKTGDVFGNIPDYISSNSVNLYKMGIIGLGILVFAIFLVVLFKTSHTTIKLGKKLQKDDTATIDNILERQDSKGKTNKNLILTSIIAVLLFGITFVSYNTYNNFITTHRFQYSEEVYKRIQKLPTKHAYIQPRETTFTYVKDGNASNNIMWSKKAKDNYQNLYYGVYGSIYNDVYKLKVRINKNEYTLNAKVMVADNAYNTNRLSFRSDDKTGAMLNGKLYLAREDFDKYILKTK